MLDQYRCSSCDTMIVRSPLAGGPPSRSKCVMCLKNQIVQKFKQSLAEGLVELANHGPSGETRPRRRIGVVCSYDGRSQALLQLIREAQHSGMKILPEIFLLESDFGIEEHERAEVGKWVGDWPLKTFHLSSVLNIRNRQNVNDAVKREEYDHFMNALGDSCHRRDFKQLLFDKFCWNVGRQFRSHTVLTAENFEILTFCALSLQDQFRQAAVKPVTGLMDTRSRSRIVRPMHKIYDFELHLLLKIAGHDRSVFVSPAPERSIWVSYDAEHPSEEQKRSMTAVLYATQFQFKHHASDYEQALITSGRVQNGGQSLQCRLCLMPERRDEGALVENCCQPCISLLTQVRGDIRDRIVRSLSSRVSS
ncbi:hypothetical protein M3Y98_00564100 [Aphelenchoides besseyi]|nr:hypothetical protein M3Y98_00564100 [Aphelenchoides besseyi]KAI6193816.1 hypothetical protein M3Y96_01059000 [Aphelenchoides besseyi]